ncbi:hypothetical protein ACH4PR_06420 [Streptomyces mirabilis]|uniref:hypothetical protein n=1 Tax=Streptomyces mirabilis TaxID=68239 RepID=UPI0037B01D67
MTYLATASAATPDESHRFAERVARCDPVARRRRAHAAQHVSDSGAVSAARHRDPGTVNL